MGGFVEMQLLIPSQLYIEREETMSAIIIEATRGKSLRSDAFSEITPITEKFDRPPDSVLCNVTYPAVLQDNVIARVTHEFTR